MGLGRAVSLVAEGTPDAMACISLEAWILMEIRSYTWIPRTREAALAGSFSTFLWTAFLVTFITQSSLGLGHKVEGRADSDSHGPAWKFDLRSVGFTGFAPKQEQWGLNLRLNPICFISDDVLIATFITREEVTTLARRDQPGELLPLRLHGIFLDAATGQVRNTKEWSITRPRGGIIAAGEGRFVVLTPEISALYSPKFEQLKTLSLSSEQRSHLWDLYPSPSGKSLLAEYHYPDALYQWIDTNSLQPQPAWKDERLPSAVSISDGELTFFSQEFMKSQNVYVNRVIVKSRTGGERVICHETGQGASCGIPHFLNNELLALWMPHGVSVLPKAGGNPLLAASFHDDEWIGQLFYPSSDGNRFAVTVWTHKGGSAFLDIDYHAVLKRIVVYDLPSQHVAFTLDAKQQKIRTVSGVALSPDGSLMAILTDGVVEVYQLPPEHTGAVDLKNGILHLQFPLSAKSKP